MSVEPCPNCKQPSDLSDFCQHCGADRRPNVVVRAAMTKPKATRGTAVALVLLAVVVALYAMLFDQTASILFALFLLGLARMAQASDLA